MQGIRRHHVLLRSFAYQRHLCKYVENVGVVLQLAHPPGVGPLVFVRKGGKGPLIACIYRRSTGLLIGFQRVDLMPLRKDRRRRGVQLELDIWWYKLERRPHDKGRGEVLRPLQQDETRVSCPREDRDKIDINNIRV